MSCGGGECVIVLRGYSTQTINFILFEKVYNESEKEIFNCININVYVIIWCLFFCFCSRYYY